MWYLNTRKNTIFLRVKILIISLTSGLSLKLYLNSLVYHRNIFGSSSKVPGNLRTSSEIFGNSQKMFGNVHLVFGTVWKIFGKSSKTPLVARAISHSFAALTREILFLPLEHKIHIFSPPGNILYLIYWEQNLPVWLNSGWTVLSAKVKSMRPTLMLIQATKSMGL